MRNLSASYVLKPEGMFFLTVWLGDTVMCIVPGRAPGDPVQAMVGRMLTEGTNVENAQEMVDSYRERFGLNDPVYVQYIKYLYNSATFNTGYSLAFSLRGSMT